MDVQDLWLRARKCRQLGVKSQKRNTLLQYILSQGLCQKDALVNC